jgi:hypothetical protein
MLHHNMTAILKVKMKNLSETNVYVNVTSQFNCYSQSKNEKSQWDKCLCKCYTSYDCYSQSKYEKSWVRYMFV